MNERKLRSLAGAAVACVLIGLMMPMVAGAASQMLSPHEVTNVPIPRAGSSTCSVLQGLDNGIWFGGGFSGAVAGRMDPDTHEFTFYGERSGDGLDDVVLALAEQQIGRLSGVIGGNDIDPDGRIWFAEFAGGKIASVDPRTDELIEYDLPNRFAGPADIDASGYDHPVAHDGIWFTQMLDGSLGHLDPVTGVVTEHHVFAPTDLPANIITGTDGGLWITLPGADAIARFDVTTKTVEQFKLPQGSFPFATVEYDGAQWFTSFLGSAVGRFDMTTHEVDMVPSPTPSDPIAINIGPDGNLWYTYGFATNKVGIVNPDSRSNVGEIEVGPVGTSPCELHSGHSKDDLNKVFTANFTQPPNFGSLSIIDLDLSKGRG